MAIDSKPGFDPDSNRLEGINSDPRDLSGHTETYMQQESPEEFSEGSAEGCFVCRLIWTNDRIRSSIINTWLSKSPPPAFLVALTATLFERDLPHFSLSVNSELFITLVTCPGSPQEFRDVYRRLPTGSPAARSTCTSGTVELWRHWYRTCTQSHARCRQVQGRLGNFTPRRLVEILETKDIAGEPGHNHRWRLVLGTNLGHVPYVTLSHCWGSSPHAVLTTANYSELLNDSSDLAGLPKTYKDALMIAHSLGFRYIWIDSLCIIQDDEADWLSESSVMDSIYRHSACNIAATWADDGTKGCFSQRDPVLTDIATIIVSSGVGRTTEYQLGDRNARLQEIAHAPLNSRGWVVQERYLSPRQLQFASSQVYWECLELIASEQFPVRLPRELCGDDEVSKPNLEAADLDELRYSWFDLVQQYSQGKLTKVSDKAVALSGLANHVRSKTNDDYLAGMWRGDLERQLDWSSVLEKRSESRIPLTGECRLPSWSWMSVRGPVQCDFRYFLRRHQDIPVFRGTALQLNDIDCAKVLHAGVDSQHPSKLHSFLTGKLIIQGIALWAQDTVAIHPPKDRYPGDFKTYRFRVDRDPAPSGGYTTSVGHGSSFHGDQQPRTDDRSSAAVQEVDKCGQSVQKLDTEPVGIWEQSIISKDTDMVAIKWDTLRSGNLSNGTRTPNDLLFLILYLHNTHIRESSGMDSGRGLVLRELGGPEKGTFTREGSFYYWNNSRDRLAGLEGHPVGILTQQLWERTSEEDRVLGRITFDDPEIKRLLKVITIV